DGIITTIAGDPNNRLLGDDGPATKASVSNPLGMAIGPDGSIYFVEQATSRVRRISINGIITTVAGGGALVFDDGIPANQAFLQHPSTVAVGRNGNIYIGETSAGGRVSVVTTSGTLIALAGNGNSPFGANSADGLLGPASGLWSASSVALSPD